MKLKPVGEDRKAFVKALSKELDVKPVYMGPPTFAYEVGPYRIGKTGEIEVDDSEIDFDLLRSVGAGDALDEALGNNPDKLLITVPMADHNAQSLTNLLSILAGKEKLLNKAIGSGHNFLIDKKLIRALEDEKPKTLNEFMVKLDEFGGDRANRGLVIEDDAITFGFPFTKDPQIVEAYTKLVELINLQALKQSRVLRVRADSTNQKYQLRNWLLRLGMIGPEYAVARKVLLKNVPGNSAFRTEEQKHASLEKLRVKREEAKKQCLEFHPL